MDDFTIGWTQFQECYEGELFEMLGHDTPERMDRL